MSGKKSKAKPVINAREAVWLIRAGKSDLDLMERYRISTKGLESLFKKLVASGEIEQGELDQRRLGFQRTHAVELVDNDVPAIPTKKVNTEDAVAAIKKGVSDTELMDLFGISARGLESLFRKLVLAGAVTQGEIDRRAITFERSHIVELTSFGPFAAEKATISSGDAVQAIRMGLTDAELMTRYGISPSGLESLFKKLVKSGKISREELDRRSRSLAWADQAYVPGEGSDAGMWEYPVLETRTRGTLTQLLWEFRAYFFAGFGTAVAIMVAVALTLFVAGALPFMAKKPAKKPPDPLMVEILALQKEAEETIRTLEDIVKVSLRPGKYKESASAYQTPVGNDEEINQLAYKGCMEDCEQTFSTKEEDDQLLMVNCKMRCMSQYNRRIKQIKERFYSKPLKSRPVPQ